VPSALFWRQPEALLYWPQQYRQKLTRLGGGNGATTSGGSTIAGGGLVLMRMVTSHLHRWFTRLRRRPRLRLFMPLRQLLPIRQV